MLPIHNSSPQEVGLDWRREQFCHLIEVPLIRLAFSGTHSFLCFSGNSSSRPLAKQSWDCWVLQSLLKELLQHPLMKCCLEAFAVMLTKEIISSLSHQWKNTRLRTIWQKNAPVSPCPQITWHSWGAPYWLGAGPPCTPEGRYSEDCPFSCSL